MVAPMARVVQVSSSANSRRSAPMAHTHVSASSTLKMSAMPLLAA